jgi:hypothetical protein
LENLNLFIGSWNVNKSSAEAESLQPWISSAFREFCSSNVTTGHVLNPVFLEDDFIPDIFAIGLQEVMGLTADQVLRNGVSFHFPLYLFLIVNIVCCVVLDDPR